MRLLLILLVGTMPATAAEAVFAAAECSLATGNAQIRQFAFDGDDKTGFRSDKNAGKDDAFTLIFEKPVTLKSVRSLTGTAKGEDLLKAGVMEISTDGKTFTMLAEVQAGAAEAKPGTKAKALRLRVTEAQPHPLAVREFTIDADPPVQSFKYPVEFTLDVSDAPEMKEWAEKVVRICEREYFMLNEELKSEGFKPRTTVSLTFKKDYKGVAAAGGGKITASVKYFKEHPEDVGAFVHETAHVVQSYRGRENPGWLVEGVADYVRFFKYEANKPKPLTPERAKFDGSYRTTAAFLEYLTSKYDKEIVKKLNKAMREGEYSTNIFKASTQKTLTELGEEWKQSLRK